MSKTIEFGVQSYCFRHFPDNNVVAKKVRDIGLKQIELCSCHGDFNNLEGFKEVIAIYKKADISIVSLGVQTFEGLDQERVWFECAVAAGARHISCHFRVQNYMQAIPKVRAWSREFDVRVGIHCHGGYMFGGQVDVLEHLISLGGPEIGLCIDTAWAMQIGPWGGNPVEWAKRFAGKIYGIHYKDFIFERNGQWQDTIVGQGNLNLPAFNAALLKGGFDGMAVIEFEGSVENPDPALKECVESMRAA